MPKSSRWIEIRPLTTLPPDCPLITEQERDAADAIVSRHRADEWLLWRAIIRERLGKDTLINYDRYGAPILCNRTGHISVSHCRQEVAVIYSQTRCAIDIESLSRNFEKIASKYISEQELSLADSQHPLFKAAVWCSKEAIYKYIGVPDAEFLNDITITSCDIAAGAITATAPGYGNLNVAIIPRAETLLAVIG